MINPLLVTFAQLRLTRAVARVPAPLKLAVAMPLMGLPFVLLSVDDSIPFVALLVLVFVIGEMLWVPTSPASPPRTSAAHTWARSAARRRSRGR